MSSLLDGDVQRGLTLPRPRGAIRTVLQENTDQREVAVERRFVKRRVAVRRAATVDGGAARDQDPNDLGAAIDARTRGGRIDRQVTFGILSDRTDVGAGVEEGFGGLAMAEERSQM